ncbi:MAG: orotidine-5'-phosphate decarboxylase [Rickettsiales bacterium]|nr:orotidine-5'-phosphate decarboxylase [Rickettsiales bacterium]
MTNQNRVLCAIDTSDVDRAVRLASDIKGHVGAVKLGLEFFAAHGAAGVNKVAASGVPIFLDLKFHDIPNTVAGAIKSCILSMDIFMLTVHISGGISMLKSAVYAAEETAWRIGKKKPLIVGVTTLTSMDSYDLQDIGIIRPITEHIVSLAQLAKDAGLDGVVCPSYEIEEIKNVCGSNFKVVVPGIRPEGSKNEDQKRTMTPGKAIKSGADYIVIGRPITQASDPIESLGHIHKDIAA